MSANETIHVSATGGQKAGNLDRYDLIPPEPLRRLAIHAGQHTFGARGTFTTLNYHLWQFWSGEEVDQVTDWVNIIAVAWHALRLSEENIMPPRPVPFDFSDKCWSRGERYDRIPAEPLRQLAHHFGVGSRKYDDDNWRKGYDWRLSFAALNRHLWAWWAGQDVDAETGSPHLIAVAWHALVLDEFTRIHPEFDTRTSTKVRRWLDAETEHRILLDAQAAEAAEPLPAWHVIVPRVVDRLTDAEKDVEWVGKLGRYRWDSERGRWIRQPRGRTIRFPTVCTTAGYGPFTEVIVAQRKPRTVEQLTIAEADGTVWRDISGDLYRWHDGEWQFRWKRRYYWNTLLSTPLLKVAGPFTEVLA